MSEEKFKMEYYGNNDWRDYLSLKHHGILGMKWGHRNGPPYPLGYSDHSSAEKKANPKGRLDNYEPTGRVKKRRVTKPETSSSSKKAASDGGIGEAIDLAKRAKRDGVSMNEAAIRKLQEKVDNGTASSYEKWMLKRQRQTQEKKAQKESDNQLKEKLREYDQKYFEAHRADNYKEREKYGDMISDLRDDYISKSKDKARAEKEFDRINDEVMSQREAGTASKPQKKLSRRQQRQKDKDDYEMAIRNDNGDIDYKKFLDNSNFEFIMLDRETEQRIKDSIDRLNEEHWRDGTNEKYRKMKADRR